MKEIYKSKYSEHIYDDSRSIMFSDWFPETENMDADDFKSEMRKWLDAFKECKPKYLYDRCMDFNYLINPEEQIWMAHLLNPELIKLGLKKYAYLVPEEIFSEASVEQLFDEFFEMNLKNQFTIKKFDNEEKALKWLLIKNI